MWTVYGQSEDLRNRIEVTLHDIGIYVPEQGYDLIETIIRQVPRRPCSNGEKFYLLPSNLRWRTTSAGFRINGAIVGAVAGLSRMDILEYVYMPFLATICRIKLDNIKGLTHWSVPLVYSSL